MPTYEIRNSRDLGGAAITHARKARGLRQDDIAEELNINAAYLREIEAGSRNLWPTRLFRILRTLGIAVTVTYDATRRDKDA